MEPIFSLPSHLSKAERYETFITQWRAFIDDENDAISLLANTTAALKEAFGFFWIGFYLVKGNELHVGPFQGSVACYRIKKGCGVCGTAWAKKQTLIVPDVEQFPGHIACSSLSRSEIVIPLLYKDDVKAVLDIDSDNLSTFDNTDRIFLEQITQLLSDAIHK